MQLKKLFIIHLIFYIDYKNKVKYENTTNFYISENKELELGSGHIARY